MAAAEQQDGSTAAAGQQHGSGNATEPQAYLVSEAAERVGIPERTLRAWIRQGRVPVLAPTEGSRGVRLSAKTLDELRQAKPLTWDGERFLGGTAAAEQQQEGLAAAEQQHGSGMPAEERHGGSTAAAEERQAGLPFVAYEELLAAADRERDHLLDEVQFLRRQLEESRQAETQMRVLLGHHAATLRQLTERPALPATASVDPDPPRRPRWWARWRR
jgi:excisionase family DNA binding protein